MTQDTEVSAAPVARAFLESVYFDVLSAVDSAAAVRRALVETGEETLGGVRDKPTPVAVLSVGKAAGPMARAAADWLGDRMISGLAITRDGMEVPPPRVEALRADHPIPGERSADAARRTLKWLSTRGGAEKLLVLLSGGASSLLAGPPAGLGVAEIAEMNRVLLASGAPIDEINRVRRQILPCAGGRLAGAAAAEKIEILVVSDVPGDRLEVIGSGPFVEIEEGPAEAIELLRARGAWSRIPTKVARWLEAAEAQALGGPGAPKRSSKRIHHRIIASNRDAVLAASASCRRKAVVPRIVSSDLRGEARSVGRRLGALGASLADSSGPICLIAGGETTVTLRGEGQGGRSQELALAAALALKGETEVFLLAAGTDGSDGPTDAAGAHADGGTIARGIDRGVHAQVSLAQNDSYGFFDAEGGLLRTGPTGTNVMDLVFVYVGRTRRS